MMRIPPMTREAVPPDERTAYDAFSASRGSEPKVRPYSVIAHMPEMAQRLEALRTYLRKEASGRRSAKRKGGRAHRDLSTNKCPSLVGTRAALPFRPLSAPYGATAQFTSLAICLDG
jgi:hypothetical protein